MVLGPVENVNADAERPRKFNLASTPQPICYRPSSRAGMVERNLFIAAMPSRTQLVGRVAFAEAPKPFPDDELCVSHRVRGLQAHFS